MKHREKKGGGGGQNNHGYMAGKGMQYINKYSNCKSYVKSKDTTAFEIVNPFIAPT